MALNFAYSSDVAQWVGEATSSELNQALDKAVADQATAWSDAERSFPANRERLILAEMQRRLSSHR